MPSRGTVGLLVFLSVAILINVVASLRRDPAPVEPGPSVTQPERSESLSPTVVRSAEQPAGSEVGLNGYDFTRDAATRWKLPGKLDEISGLAMTPDGRLLAHDDEKGLVFEVDYRTGDILKAFGLASQGAIITDDLEGIAVAEGVVYMVTSTGRLYEFFEGAAGEQIGFTVYNSGVGGACEIEGLAFDSRDRALLLLCKNPLIQELEGTVAVYRWSIDTKQIVDDGSTLVELSAVLSAIDKKKFQPSGIEVHPESGNYFLVAARQGAVAEVTPEGRLVSAVRFPAEWHRQAEGITFASDNTMIVSDEGAGKRARLTLYPVLGTTR